MELWQLRYFAIVSEARSIGQASVHLGVAGPTISRAIRSLETELGVHLFVRDGRGMHLTTAGLTLLERATRILRDTELARQEVSATEATLSGEIAIGATPSLIAVLGLPLVRLCRERYPNVRPRLIEGYSHYLRDWVRTGTIDIALVNGEAAPGARLSYKPLAVERLYALGAVDRLTPWRDGIPLKELLANTLLLPSAQNPIRVPLDQAAAALAMSVKTLLEVDSVALLKDLVIDGVSMAVLPFGAVRREVEMGIMTATPIIEPEVHSKTHVAYSADLPPGKVGKAMLGIVRQILADEAERLGGAFVRVL